MDAAQARAAEDATRPGRAEPPGCSPRALLDHLPVGVFETDAGGLCVYANPRFCEIAGIDPSARGAGLEDAIHPEDRERVIGAWSDAMPAARDLHLECRLQRPDGTTRRVTGDVAAVHDQAGCVTGYVGTIADVTKERASTERSRRSRQRAQALLEHSTDIIFIVDPAGLLLYASPSAGRLLGYPQDRPLGRSALNLLHPDDREPTARVLAALIVRGGITDPLLVRVCRVDGTYLYLEMVAHSLFDDPDIGGVVVNARDVTDRLRAEENLRRSEHRFRALVQDSFDVFAVLDYQGTLTYLNAVAVEKGFGYPEGSLIGTSGFDLVHPDDLEHTFTAFLDTSEKRRLGEPIEYRLRHADGHWVPVESVASNLLDDPEVAGIVLNIRDITERRQMEASLREAQERLREAFDNAPIGIALVGLDGRYLQVNPALCEMTGYSADELLTVHFLDLTHPDDLDRSIEFARRFAAEEQVPPLIEKRYVHRDGHTLWVRVSVSLVHDADGKAAYFVAQFQDITEQRRLEAQLAHDATHDTLTDLPTRALGLDRLEQALAAARRNGRQVATLFVDLDDFKPVNDTFGHAVGDAVLVAVAARLRDAVREADTAGRFGGDEFIVVCPDVSGRDDALRVAERIMVALARPFPAGEAQVTVGASIGIVLSNGDADPVEILRRADAATYRAKERGGRCHVLDEGMLPAA